MNATQLPHVRPPVPARSTSTASSTKRAKGEKRRRRRLQSIHPSNRLSLPLISSASLAAAAAASCYCIASLRPAPACTNRRRGAAMAALQAPASSSLARAPGAAQLRSSFSAPWSVRLPAPAPARQRRVATAARITMRVASKQAYICRDCGYIYNDRTPFDKLPDKYFCPVCGAPKRRFRPYEPAVSKNANATDVRKARKEQLKKDEAIGQALPIAIVVGVIALAGLYFYLNSTYN